MILTLCLRTGPQTVFVDTPWDEPTQKSYEYSRYLTGECFNDEPWTRFSRDVLGTFLPPYIVYLATSSHIAYPTELITGMLTPDPSKRMSMREIFRHRWMARWAEIDSRVCSTESDACDHVSQTVHNRATRLDGHCGTTDPVFTGQWGPGNCHSQHGRKVRNNVWCLSVWSN